MGFYASRGYTLDQAKQVFATEIENVFAAAVLDVFDSTATGVNRRYYCAEADQLRMVNGRLANVPMSLMCGVVPAEPDTDPSYDWLQHTSAECGKVHTDYVDFSKDAYALRISRLNQLAACTTVAEVDAMFDQILYVFTG